MIALGVVAPVGDMADMLNSASGLRVTQKQLVDARSQAEEWAELV